MDEDIDLAKSVDRECCEFKLKQVSSKRARTIAKFLSSTSVHFRTRNSLHADLSALLSCDAILKLRDASIWCETFVPVHAVKFDSFLC